MCRRRLLAMDWLSFFGARLNGMRAREEGRGGLSVRG